MLMDSRVWTDVDVRFAEHLAAFVHRGQTYGPDPYTAHLQRVVSLVESYGPVAQICAWLHDSLEDTELNRTALQNLFGDQVTRSVDYMTDPKNMSRAARKAVVNKRFAEVLDLSSMEYQQVEVWPAFIVKPADRFDNIRSCVNGGKASLLEMYRKEHVDFTAAVLRPFNHHLFVQMDALLAGG